MNTCFVLLGSNLGNRLSIIQEAHQLLIQFVGDVIEISSIYETAPWGKPAQPNFLNQVLKIQTDLEPLDLLVTTQQLEEKLGREPSEKWEARLIDIDILYFNSQIIQLSHLKIPHPEIQNRRFTLVPLVEIAPQYLHPILKKTNQELLDACTDKLKVSKVAVAKV